MCVSCAERGLSCLRGTLYATWRRHAFFYGPGDHLVLSGEDETTELKVWDSRSGEVVRALTTEVGGGKSSGG